MDKPSHIEVEAIRGFRVDGREIAAGKRVLMPLEDALTTISIGRARAVGPEAAHVALRSTVEWTEAAQAQRRTGWSVNPAMGAA
jgi:hypothetical protein